VDLLKREMAPILREAWAVIDEEARKVLELHLGGRRLVDFSGPHGWELAGVNTGKLDVVDWQPVDGVSAALRLMQALLEVRTPIHLPIMELDSIGRGAKSLDFAPIADAAQRIARTEDGAIFNGLEEAGITGLLAATPHDPLRVRDVGDYPRAIRTAMSKLARFGINGPYALALGAKLYDEVFTAVEGGYPVARQISSQILDGPIVRAPVLDNGVVLSMRGGDYELTVGQDLSVGYAGHDRSEIELFLVESFTFRVLEPGAAVALVRE
jgi:uncharacterized linocin/CFP29 family protein